MLAAAAYRLAEDDCLERCPDDLPAFCPPPALRGRGLDVVTISADEPEQEAAALKLLKDDGVSGPAYLKKAMDDDEFDRLIDAKWSGALPALFLYDRSGKKVRSFIGETPVRDVEAAVEKLL